jgi:hypothetical protein
MMNMRNDTSGKAVFFSGTSERKVPNQVNNSIVKSAITDMRVVDTVDGARMDLAPEENIFVLIPRKAAIKKLSNVNKTLLSMSALDKAKGFSEKRGKKRITATEGKNSNYVTVGLKPNRGSHGILDSWPHKLSAKDKKLHDVEKVIPSPHNMMNMRNDTSSKAVFFSGTSKRKVPNQVNNSIVKPAIMNMRVVDTVGGAWMDLAPDENVFLLIPRKAAIKKLSNVNKT